MIAALALVSFGIENQISADDGGPGSLDSSFPPISSYIVWTPAIRRQDGLLMRLYYAGQYHLGLIDSTGAISRFFETPPFTSAFGISTQPDGKILLGLNTWGSPELLLRLMPDGRSDLP
jgi:hypothetical protein